MNGEPQNAREWNKRSQEKSKSRRARKNGMLNKNGREKTKTTGEKERNGEGGQRKKIPSETISLNDNNEKEKY